jgi:hypothetical protein
MKTGVKILGALALVAVCGLTTNVLANCQSGQVFPISQCGDRAWFSITPGDAGPVDGYFWQLGYGNKGRTATDPGASAANGTGFQLPLTTNGCIGNDSGALNTPQELDLVDSAFVGGPAGALCFGAGTNWINTGSDGCADNSKQSSGINPPSGGNPDDNLLNPFWGSAYGLGTGPPYFTTYYQLDAPMGVLLTEGTGKYFAAAFFATRARSSDPDMASNDASEGDYTLGDLVNGDPNPVTPGKNNVIPWQLIPQPNIQATFQDPGNPSTSPRILNITWDPIRIVHDGSVRPSGASTVVNGGRPGVGVMDASGGNPNSLIRFVVETAPATDAQGTCGAFTAALSVPGSQGSANVTVPPDTCVRLSTQFGTTPTQITCSLANASRGTVGDLGVSVSSANTVVGGTLASNRITVTSARKNKNQTATIQFKTTSELNITSLEIRARNQKGQEFLVTTVSPKQGTTGIGDSYSITVTKTQLKGARTIFVVAQPGGTRSNEITLGR